MRKFKDYFTDQTFNKKPLAPSVMVTDKVNQHTLYLTFNSKDQIVEAGYAGKLNAWLSSLCEILQGKKLFEAEKITLKSWDEEFKSDLDYWDFKSEIIDDFIFHPLELLFTALNIYKGREYLYQKASPLVCRCFGVRESDIVDYLQVTETPSLEGLAQKTKAGMGCRSCVVQLQRWIGDVTSKKESRFYRDKSNADWLVEIDESLQDFPSTRELNLQVYQFKKQQVTITYIKDNFSQKDEETLCQDLQKYFREKVDSGLSVFLKGL